MSRTLHRKFISSIENVHTETVQNLSSEDIDIVWYLMFDEVFMVLFMDGSDFNFDSCTAHVPNYDTDCFHT